MSNSGAMRKQAHSIRVLIADGQPSNCRELKELLAGLSFVEIVGEAASGLEAVELAARECPDVVLIAEKIPGLSMSSTMRQIIAKKPKTRVFVIGEDPDGRDTALSAGAEAYFVGRNGHTALREALLKLHARSQFPTLSPDVKAPAPVRWTDRRIWIAIGSGVGLGLLASVVLFPGVSLPAVALICGLLFFLYGLKYYLSVALILFATTGGSNGNGNGLNGVFNGMGITNGLKRRPELARRSVLRMLLDRIRRSETVDGSSGQKVEAGDSQKTLDAGSNGNPYKFRPTEQPFVSIHLPLYNESRVVDRLLEACTRLDYQNYEVLVADDSTDKTLGHLEKWAKHPRVRISHRINRTGFKGAALKHAMEVMDPRTRFVVIFDADFIPPPNILHQFLSYFYGVNGNSSNHILEEKSGEEPELVDESLAVVQGYQWHILNASENWITRGVRTEFSGSYVVERPGQELTGGMKMISGSVFMIRADLLRSLGWGTSITEDWELTIRLYIDGYRVLYSPFIQAPAECVSDFKQLARQRMRWAEGHTFNVKRYFFPILLSNRLTRREKLEFAYYVPYYLQSAFFIVGTLAWLISEIFLRSHLPFWTATLGWSLVFTNTFALLLMNVAGLFLERGVRRNWAGLLSFILLTFLLVPYQAYAAVKGLLEPHEGGWHRTDKTGVITEVIDKLGLGRRMRRLMPKPKRRSIDLSKRLGMPLARITKRLPKPLQRLAARPSLALRIGAGLAISLMLLWILSTQIPLVFAAPDSFFLRDTSTNGASPAGKDMNLNQGSSEKTLVFDSTDDQAYWYTDVTYPTGGEDASIAAGNYTLNMHFSQLPGSWWDTAYKYRLPITITAGLDDVPVGYSVNVEFNHQSMVSAGHSEFTGWDLRIVYWNGSGWTELDRVRDDLHPYNQVDTQLWFSTQAAISANDSDTDYYLYYGNNSAGAPPQDWKNVFLLYDNFNDGSFDSTDRWTCTMGTCTESGGALTLNSNDRLFANAGYSFGTDTRWEARVRLGGDGTEDYFNYWGAATSDNFLGENWIILWTDLSDTWSETFIDTSPENYYVSVSTPTSFHTYAFNREGTSNVRFYQDTTQLSNHTDEIPTVNLRALIWNDNTDYDQLVDFVRVRKYVASEPSASPGAEQDAPYVKINVSVHHTKGDGTEPAEIVAPSTTTIDANTANLYELYPLAIGSGTEKTFLSTNPQRLRVHIDVTEVNGSGSFTLAYDSVDNPSSLDTPEIVVPGATLLLLLVVVLIPITTSLMTRKRWLGFSIAIGVLLLAILATRIPFVEAAIEDTSNVFYFYDDMSPQTYMMYQTQPTGSDQSGSATIEFYSDTFPAGWSLQSGTASVYIYVDNGSPLSEDNLWTLFAGSGASWTQLGWGSMGIDSFANYYQQLDFSTNSYVFSEGECLKLVASDMNFTDIWWDGSYNQSRLVVPGITVLDPTLLFILLAVLVPLLTNELTKRRRLAVRLVGVGLSFVIMLGLLAQRVVPVSAAVDDSSNNFYFYDDTSPLTYMMYQTQPSGTEASAAGPTTVNFYSDTWPEGWQVDAGSSNYLGFFADGKNKTFTFNVYGGTTLIGTLTQSISTSGIEGQAFFVETSQYTFAAGERLRVEWILPVGMTIYWDGAYSLSRFQLMGITVFDPTLVFMILVPLFPILTGLLARKRRLTVRIISVVLSFLVVLSLLAQQIIPVSAAPDSFFLHDTAADGTWYSVDWSYRKKITIYASQVSADLDYFPVLINLSSDAELSANAQSDGGDIVFTLADGTTKLDHEIEKYVTGNGELVAWVEVPDLSGSVNTVLYMYYGNGTVEDQWNVSGTWNANYRAVWHLKEDPTGTPPQFLDSTSNPNDGTAQPVGQEPTQTGAKIDGGLQFDDSNERHVTVADHTSLKLATNMTVSAWVKTTDTETDVGLIVNKWGSAVADRNYWLGKFDGSSIAFYVDETQNVTASLSLINDGEWHYVVGVADVANSLLRIYVDDSQANTAAYDGTSVTGTSDLHIGSGSGEMEQEFDGLIDEVRVASEALSGDWIKTSFDNQDSPSSFYGLSGQETPGISPAGKEMNTTLGSGSANLLFDSADDEAYWYTDIAYPPGEEDSTIAAGDYTLNMHFDQLPQVPADWYNASWLYRKEITIYGSQVAAGGVSNFPVLINLTSDTELAASACNAPSAGYDILFTESNGTSKLSHEIESFDDSTGALVAWVNVTSLTNPADTTIYMYYGNSGCTDQQDVANVWTSYVGVWHLKESSGSGYYLKNSRQDDYHASAGSTLYNSGSIIDGGRDFNSDLLEVQNGTDLLDGDTSFTVEFWGYPDYATDAIWVADEEAMVLESDSLWGCRWKSSGTGTGWIQCDVKWSDSSTSYLNCWDCLNRAEWNHIVLTFDGTYLRWYINGSQEASENNSGKSLRTNSFVSFGGSYAIDSNFDEFRYARAGLGVGWFQTEYNNQGDPSNFYGLGSEETLPSVEIAVSVYHTDTDGSNEVLIAQNLSTLIDTTTTDPYEFTIGNDPIGQTYTKYNPQLLRLHVDVIAVNGGGSFTLAYDSVADPSALNTPGMVIPEWGGAFLVLMPLIPYLMTLIWQRKRRIGNYISLLLAGCVALGLLASNVPSASAEPMLDVSNSTTFWWYDDTTPYQYMMYQTQPTGNSTSAANKTVSFYSDIWPTGWQVNAGTSTVYFYVQTTGAKKVTFTLYEGSGSTWNQLGTGEWSGSQGSITLVNLSFSTNANTFTANERLRLDVAIGNGATVYWDGSYNNSRLVTPTIVVPENALAFVAVAVLIPIVIGAKKQRKRKQSAFAERY